MSDVAPTPTPPLKGRGLSDRETAARTDTPPLQGRGRGWGLSAGAIATLQGRARARAMRNAPTEPEKRLWRHLSNRQLEGFKFRRQQAIGRYIADFVCPAARLIIEVDGDTHDEAADRVRDAALAGLGYRVVRVANRDVMTNMEGVLGGIAEALREVERPHPNPSPEGEGLEARMMGLC